jgi:hypothetical protein
MSLKHQKERELLRRQKKMGNGLAIPGAVKWQTTPFETGDQYPTIANVVLPSGIETRIFRGASQLQHAAVEIAAALVKQLNVTEFFRSDNFYTEAELPEVKQQRIQRIKQIAELSVGIADHVLHAAKQLETQRAAEERRQEEQKARKAQRSKF